MVVHGCGLAAIASAKKCCALRVIRYDSTMDAAQLSAINDANVLRRIVAEKLIEIAERDAQLTARDQQIAAHIAQIA